MQFLSLKESIFSFGWCFCDWISGLIAFPTLDTWQLEMWPDLQKRGLITFPDFQVIAPYLFTWDCKQEYCYVIKWLNFMLASYKSSYTLVKYVHANKTKKIIGCFSKLQTSRYSSNKMVLKCWLIIEGKWLRLLPCWLKGSHSKALVCISLMVGW